MVCIIDKSINNRTICRAFNFIDLYEVTAGRYHPGFFLFLFLFFLCLEFIYLWIKSVCLISNRWMYVTGIKTVIYMISLQNKFNKNKLKFQIVKGTNVDLLFFFIIELNQNWWLCIDMPTLFDVYDCILLSYLATLLEWQKLKRVSISCGAALWWGGVGGLNVVCVIIFPVTARALHVHVCV